MLLRSKILGQLVGLCCLLWSGALVGQVQLGNDILGVSSTDRFGKTIGLSDDGRRVVIGGPENNANGVKSGHVRIHEYQTSTSSWIQVGNDINGSTGGEQLGFDVDISGDGKRVVTLSPNYVHNGSVVGLVKVFEENNGTWTQLGSDILGQGQRLYYSVDISRDGKRIAVGTTSNVVKVFEETPSGWVQVGSDLVGSGTFGFSVSLSTDGKTLAVGATSHTVNNGVPVGQVHVFKEFNGTWNTVGSPIVGSTQGFLSGYDVALSGNGGRVAIGTPNYPQWTFKGHIRVYENVLGFWTAVGGTIDGENNGDLFGWSVAISGDGKRIIGGAVSNTVNGANSGNAMIYEENNNSWTQVGNDIDGVTASDSAGSSVAISVDGHTVAVGAPGFNPAGQVRIYDIPSPSCIAAREITSHYCKRRVSLLEPTGTVHNQEIVLAIDPQEFIPNGACTASPTSWTHFNIVTESFPSSGPTTTPIAQATLNNVPVSSLYSVAGSNASFYDLPASAVASGSTSSRNTTYTLRVTITGVNGTTVSAHSTQYNFSVSTDIAYQCASPSNNGGPRGFSRSSNNFQKSNTNTNSDKNRDDFPIIKREGDSPR